MAREVIVPLADVPIPASSSAAATACSATGTSLVTALRAQGRLGLLARVVGAEAWSAIVVGDLSAAIIACDQRIHLRSYDSEPTCLITVNRLRHEHWTQIQSGWMIESARPLLAVQIAAARDVAAKTGPVIESRNTPASLARSGPWRRPPGR